MQDKQTVYFVSGLPGMGKTSRILRDMSGKKENLIALSTDKLRLPIPCICDGQEITIQCYLEDILKIDSNRKIDGFDGLGTLGFIKYHSIFSGQKGDLFIDTIAFTPQEVRSLEVSEPSIKIRAAFIGYSKKARDTRLEKLRLKYDDYIELDRSNKFKKQTEDLKLPNYKYFDLIESVPLERGDKDIVPLEQADFDRNAQAVVDYLLAEG